MKTKIKVYAVIVANEYEDGTGSIKVHSVHTNQSEAEREAERKQAKLDKTASPLGWQVWTQPTDLISEAQ